MYYSSSEVEDFAWRGKMKLPLFLSVLVLIVLCKGARIPTANQVKVAKITINKLINARADRVLDFNSIAGFVRLSFHDCVGEGGCDGCIDFDNKGNRGLKVYTQDLDALYDIFKDDFTRADFYALAAVTALEMAGNDQRTRGQRFDSSMLKFGREDCSTSPREDKQNKFPSAKGNFEDNMRFFRGMFGEDFTVKEMVALMGAHKLGRAKVENSGYKGEWIPGAGCSSRLNGKYFWKLLVFGPKYVQYFPRAKGRYNPIAAYNSMAQLQWGNPKTIGMLTNSDMALVWNFNVDKEGCFDCEICDENEMKTNENCCKHSLGYKYVKGYEGQFHSPSKPSGMDFHKDFQDVIYKMLDVKQSNLQAVDLRSLPQAIKIKFFENDIGDWKFKGKYVSMKQKAGLKRYGNDVYDTAYASMAEAMEKEGALGDVAWTELPDISGIISATKPGNPPSPTGKPVIPDKDDDGVRCKKKEEETEEPGLADAIEEEIEEIVNIENNFGGV